MDFGSQTHQNYLNKLCNKYKIFDEDDKSDIYLRAYNRCLVKYDSTKQDFKSCLWRYINWECLNFLKKTKDSARNLENYAKTITTQFHDFDSQILYEDIINQIKDEQLKKIVQMRIDGYKDSEIAKKLNIKPKDYKKLYLKAVGCIKL